MRLRTLCLSLAVVICACASADGGYFPTFEGVAETADQRAVIIDHGDAETIVLQTGYEGDASGFAWVIPVPTQIAGASAVGTADPSVFSSLSDLTAPRYFTGFEGSTGVCGCSGGSGDAGAPSRGGVTVWDRFDVDGYNVAVLSATESGDLAGWLRDNGYAFPEAGDETLAYYVDKQWFFVAFRIAPSGGGGGGEEFRPITLTFATDELVFPMCISRVSTTGRAEVLLYVLSEHRVKASNYPTRTIQAGRAWDGGDFDAVYDGWFEGTIADAGGTALVVEFAGDFPLWWAGVRPFDTLTRQGEEYFVTRLRTRLTPAQMDEDIMLTAAANDDPLEVVVGSELAATRGRAAFAALLLASVQGLALRRWRLGRRFAATTALLGILLVLL
jgi:hypothetical protein